MHKKHGFGLVGILLIVVVIGVVGFAGWFVWNRQNNTVSKQDSSLSQSQQLNQELDKNNDETTEKSTIPEGWVLYKNEEFGFSIAYPQEIGQLNSRDFENSPNILEYLSADSEPNTFTDSSQGLFIISVEKIEGYIGYVSKYGLRLEYNDGNWVVSEKDYSYVNDEGKAIGSIYDIKVAKEINGHKVYDFYNGDEGCEGTSWVFKTTEAFISIDLPNICGSDGDTMAPPTEEAVEVYKAKSAEVLNTLSIY